MKLMCSFIYRVQLCRSLHGVSSVLSPVFVARGAVVSGGAVIWAEGGVRAGGGAGVCQTKPREGRRSTVAAVSSYKPPTTQSLCLKADKEEETGQVQCVEAVNPWSFYSFHRVKQGWLALIKFQTEVSASSSPYPVCLRLRDQEVGRPRSASSSWSC